jgi:hypothetical protein
MIVAHSDGASIPTTISSLIHEMQDRIREIKIFIKIDLKEGYYKI